MIARGESSIWPGLLDGGEGEKNRRRHDGCLREGAESKRKMSRRVPAAVPGRESTSVEALTANPEQRHVASPEQEYDTLAELASNPDQYQQKLATNTKKETPRSGSLTANNKQQRVALSGRVGTTPVDLVTKPEHLQQKLASK